MSEKLSSYDCGKCDKEIRKICPGHYADDWYEPSEIKFCRNQMFFLIACLEQLQKDNWPVNPNLTGYEDVLRGKPNYAGAPYITAREFGMDVSWRLDKTGEDGKDLHLQIAQHGIKDIWLLTRRARQAFIYASGFKMKLTPYRKWKWEYFRRKNVTIPIIYPLTRRT